MEVVPVVNSAVLGIAAGVPVTAITPGVGVGCGVDTVETATTCATFVVSNEWPRVEVAAQTFVADVPVTAVTP